MTLSKIIYMCQLKGYEILGKEDHICLLLCVLYGLKQARCKWYHHFYKVMHKLDFTHCQAKHVVFYKYTDEDALIMAVDVNDLTMARSSKQIILHFNWSQEGFGCWLQLMCCTYLILLSEYFRCIPGTPRILEVS